MAAAVVGWNMPPQRLHKRRCWPKRGVAKQRAVVVRQLAAAMAKHNDWVSLAWPAEEAGHPLSVQSSWTFLCSRSSCFFARLVRMLHAPDCAAAAAVISLAGAAVISLTAAAVLSIAGAAVLSLAAAAVLSLAAAAVALPQLSHCRSCRTAAACRSTCDLHAVPFGHHTQCMRHDPDNSLHLRWTPLHSGPMAYAPCLTLGCHV
eukprot:359367-Chlamydomonas_euryale.AAC.3